VYHDAHKPKFPLEWMPPVRIPRRFLILTALLLLGLTGRPAWARSGPEPELKIFLVTMGPGEAVWEKFGHNAIWVHDPVHGTDRVYNYGVFDFDSPGYWGRFVRGNWIYQIAAADIYQTLRAYQYYDRTVTAQELNLTPAEALELQEYLEWNLRPENAEYLYDYYRDNCSTRVRDVLDRVLGGALYRATANEPTATTYRWHSHRLVQGDAVTYTGLSLGLGPAADRPISRWEEMFLPGKLQERVRELRISGPDGSLVPLVRSEQVLYESASRAVEPVAPAPVVGKYLLAGIMIGALVLILGWASTGQGIRRLVGRIGFSLSAGGWALLIGGGGLLLTTLWGLTNHSIAYRNANLFQVNPLALPLIILFPALAFDARWARRASLWLSSAVALASLLGAILQLTPWFEQVNGEIIALVLPVNLALALAVHWLRRSSPSPRAGTASGLREYPRSVSGGR
jgi:hypothetical protein